MAVFCSFRFSDAQQINLHYLNNDFDRSPSESSPGVVTELGETLQNGCFRLSLLGEDKLDPLEEQVWGSVRHLNG